MSFLALPLLALIGLVALGVLVAMVMLLANPKTRVAGAVLLMIVGVLVVVGGAAVVALALLGDSGGAPYVYTLF